MFDKLIAQLKRHEGYSKMPYRCTAGKLTIGYGKNVDDAPLTKEELALINAKSLAEVLENGISEPDAEKLLIREVQKIYADLGKRLPWFADLDETRQAVLVNMAFNLGMAGLMSFKNTLAMIKAGDYKQAAENMLKSKWAEQTGRRARELAEQMESGKWKQN